MEKAKYNFRSLEVWQLGMDLVNRTYSLSRKFPSNEKFALTSQIRRAAISVPLNLAEGSIRHSKADFAHFIRFSLGSLVEVMTCLEISEQQNYLNKSDMKGIDELIEKLYFKLLALDRSQRMPISTL